jgi:hypothetical protein
MVNICPVICQPAEFASKISAVMELDHIWQVREKRAPGWVWHYMDIT